MTEITGVPRFAWMNGQVIPWERATLHVRTDAVMRGGTVFEGVAGYWRADAEQLSLFRVDRHLERLARSMHALRMQLEMPVAEFGTAMKDLLRQCGFREDVHVRPTVYFGEGRAFGYRREDIDVGAVITAVPMPREFNSKRGIKVCVSSWRRIGDEDQPPRIKASANYLNSRLATVQAHVDGYDSAILLNRAGQVSEGPGACVVLVRKGRLVTPRTTDGTLESITRETVVQLAEDRLSLTVEARGVDRTELYEADEIFECGTAHEVTPIVAVDGYAVGSGEPGPVTVRLRQIYDDVVRGGLPEYARWLSDVYER